MIRKTMIVWAGLGLAGVASAQSSVTLFGVVDAALSHYSSKSEDLVQPSLQRPLYVNKGSIKVSRTALSSSSYNQSRLGFRGSEDLGGGLAAGFWLEAGMNNDDGTGFGSGGGLSFNRRSTVSLSGGFGELRLGRDYVPTFWNDLLFDPLGATGVGASLINVASNTNPAGMPAGYAGNGNYIRSNNAISYFLPRDIGGFYGQLMYGFHENQRSESPSALQPAFNSKAGKYVGGRFGYANGPLDVALAYGQSTVSDAPAGRRQVDTANLGASYDFGMLKLFGEISRVRNTLETPVPAVWPVPGARVDLKGYLLGVHVPVGPGLIRAAWSRVRYDDGLEAPWSDKGDPHASKVSLGYVHNLSKRTALYATVAHVRNRNGAALTVGGPVFASAAGFTPHTSTGYEFGIRHAF